MDEVLVGRVTGSVVLWDGVAAVAVPAPEVSSRDARRPFGREALEIARRLIEAEARSTSVSHTRGVTVAVAAADGRRIGVDIERVRPARPRVAARILAPGETAGDSWTDALALFCAKEAAYKSLPPNLQAGLSFRRVRLRQSSNGQNVVHRAHDDVVLADVATAVGAELVVAIAVGVEPPCRS